MEQGGERVRALPWVLLAFLLAGLGLALLVAWWLRSGGLTMM